METASTYFTRRARQERAKAADATSAGARKAHIELALRLVNVALEPSFTERLKADTTNPQLTKGAADMGNALANAFPLPSNDTFEDLLEAVGTAAL